MIFRLKLLEKNTKEIQEFHDKFCAKICYDIPVGYFNKGDCYALFYKEQLAAGFCLVNAPPLHLRSIIQIPDILYNWHVYEDYIYDICEFTGYFIENKKLAFIFTLYLVWTVIWYNSRQFVYSYPISQRGLERYYSRGNPLRIYTGYPKTLEGMQGVEKEHVEILTKWGIVKIFLFRTLRYFSRRYYGKKSRTSA